MLDGRRPLMRNMMFCAVSLAALVGGAPAALANPPQIQTFPINFTFFDPCSGEDVHFTGTETVASSFSANTNRFHLSQNFKFRADGVGQLTGANYSWDVEENVEKNGTFTGFPIEENDIFNYHIIGQGAVANEAIKETIRTTINANGTI